MPERIAVLPLPGACQHDRPKRPAATTLGVGIPGETIVLGEVTPTRTAASASLTSELLTQRLSDVAGFARRMEPCCPQEWRQYSRGGSARARKPAKIAPQGRAAQAQC